MTDTELHPLMKAINEAHRTLSPVTLTIEEAERVMHEILDLRIRLTLSTPGQFFAHLG